MKVIVAGSRGFSRMDAIGQALDRVPFRITAVVSGCAPGPDREGERWAKGRGIPTERFPADWKSLGKAAGVLRNREMALHADALVAFWDGESRGTKDMIRQALSNGLHVLVYQTKKQ